MSDGASKIPAAEQFVHLHLHSEFSLLDGGNRIDRLVNRVKELGMTSVAVTDHGNLFGAMSFYQTARKAGIKPILGVEAYVAPGDRKDRTHTGVMDGGYHLVLLAETLKGWENLLYMCSEAYLSGFYYKPRIDRELLSKHNEGLIAINGHLGSEIAFHMREYEKTNDEAHYTAAREVAQWHHETFAPTDTGPRFYVELQHHAPEQNAINPHLIRLAQELDLPLVADNDAHFLNEDEHDAHDTLICISMGKIKDDPNRLHYPTELYVKSPQQMRELFEGTYGTSGKEAIDNTVKIAERCNVELEFGNHAPVVRVNVPKKPKKYKGEADLTEWFKAHCDEYTVEPFDPSQDKTPAKKLEAECDKALRSLCEAGLIWRYGPDFAKKDHDTEHARNVRARLDRELGILSDKHISAYFLIVWDFVNWARQRSIPANARGSGVGTMVGYLLGLSNACPVHYGLLFERFTDPDRSEYPDIDIDLCQNGRAEVINFVREKYGHVAQIITFGTLKARAAIRDVGRVLNIPLPEVDAIAKLIPEQLNITLDQALEQEPDLKAKYDNDPLIKRLIDTSRVLEGQARHASVHAAGVIVATRPLHEIVPLFKQANSDDVITQWDGPTCERIGLLKMDFLGLRTLSVIECAKDLIRATLPTDEIWKSIHADSELPDEKTMRETDPLDLERLTYEDPRIFDLFARADTTGVFQFESGGMRRLLTEMRPDRLEDLIAANALFRPGPMDLIPDYNARKHGVQAVPTVHPIVDKFTAETYGVMVYQEQVMQIVHELGGIPLRSAYSLIKAISKKKSSIIDANRPKFIEGAVEKGLERKAADELFELILKFAGYGFNKSHSTGYSIVAYQTAYLKAYFPAQYMAAFLTFESQAQKVEDWIKYKDDCRRTRFPDGNVGIDVAPPDVNLSRADFTVVFEDDEPRDANHGHIRFGLKAIKGVGNKAIDAIIKQRDDSGEYRSLFSFCERVPPGTVNKATIEALITCGAFDAVHTRDERAAMVKTIEPAVAAGQQIAKDREAGQGALFGGPPPAESPDAPAQDEELSDPPLVRTSPWDETEMLQREKDVLGFFASAHPLESWQPMIAEFANTTITDVKTTPQDHRVIVAGIVKSVRPITTRSGRNPGQRMAIVTLEDLHGTIDVVLFSETYSTYGSAIITDSIVFLQGNVDYSRGDAQIIVEKVTPAEKVMGHLATRLEIEIDETELNGTGVGALDHLAGIIRSHRSLDVSAVAVPIELTVATENKLVRLECANQRVACDGTLVQYLAKVVGEHRVRVRGGIPVTNNPRQQKYQRRPRKPETADV